MQKTGISREALVGAVRGLGISPIFYETVDSTNSEAKRLAPTLSCPAVLVAEGQTAGRGRMGRSFFSPIGTGLYFSYLSDRAEPAETVCLTAAVAVAAARAIARVTGLETEIKWVNDLLLRGRKVAGILCERFFVEGRSFCVIGIGINLTSPEGDFPEELASKAGALDVPCDKNALILALCEELCALVSALPAREFMEEYRTRSAVLRHRVHYTVNGTACEGVAVAIDDDGALVVRDADGAEHRLASGEISLSYEWE